MGPQLEFAFYALQIPGLLFLKLSTLYFYKRIFAARAFQMCFWVLSILSILWGLSFFVASCALCSSFEDRIFTLQTLTTKCANSFVVLISQAVLDVVVDLGILVLPIPFIGPSSTSGLLLLVDLFDTASGPALANDIAAQVGCYRSTACGQSVSFDLPCYADMANK